MTMENLIVIYQPVYVRMIFCCQCVDDGTRMFYLRMAAYAILPRCAKIFVKKAAVNSFDCLRGLAKSL